MAYWDSYSASVEDLMGKIIVTIDKDDSELIFKTLDGYTYKMYHDQDCCESVYIEDIIGDLDDLIGTPVTMAECIQQDGKELKGNSSDDDEHEYDYSDESSTWTFYKIATYKGYVTIRWFGTSNGYYSETADFAVMKDKAPWEE